MKGKESTPDKMRSTTRAKFFLMGKSPAKWRSPRKSRKNSHKLKSGKGTQRASEGGVLVVGVREAKFVYRAGLALSCANEENDTVNFTDVNPSFSGYHDKNTGTENVTYVTPREERAIVGQEGREGELVLTPRLGMVFTTREEIKYFYKRYAKAKGFGVARAQSAYTTDKKRKRATTWRCELWGGPDIREKREKRKRERAMDVGGSVVPDELTKKRRTSKKCNCPERIYAGLNKDGTWELRKVVLEHEGHNPTSSDARLVKEYRMQHLTNHMKRKLLNDVEVGVPVSKIHRSMARERGGYENMELTERDLRYVVDVARKTKMNGGDANALVLYFEKMQKDNKNFFHAQRLDDEGCLKDVIWIDARSQAAYEDFGDVVCFDCTYLTNEYGLAFGNFVGVNHHGTLSHFYPLVHCSFNRTRKAKLLSD